MELYAKGEGKNKRTGSEGNCHLSRSGFVHIVILNATPYNPLKGGWDEQTTELGTTKID